MAHRIDVTKLLGGPKHFIYHAYIESDGLTADIDSYELVKPED